MFGHMVDFDYYFFIVPNRFLHCSNAEFLIIRRHFACYLLDSILLIANFRRHIGSCLVPLSPLLTLPFSSPLFVAIAIATLLCRSRLTRSSSLNAHRLLFPSDHIFSSKSEVVNNRKNKGYGLAADIWSLGCTVLEMLTGRVPYSHLEGVSMTLASVFHVLFLHTILLK